MFRKFLSPSSAPGFMLFKRLEDVKPKISDSIAHLLKQNSSSERLQLNHCDLQNQNNFTFWNLFHGSEILFGNGVLKKRKLKMKKHKLRKRRKRDQYKAKSQ